MIGKKGFILKKSSQGSKGEKIKGDLMDFCSELSIIFLNFIKNKNPNVSLY